MIQRIYTDDELCDAVGPHHGDRCSNGRIQSPNAQFTRECEVCKGSGLRQKKASDMSKFKVGDNVRVVGGPMNIGKIAYVIETCLPSLYRLDFLRGDKEWYNETLLQLADSTSEPTPAELKPRNKYARTIYPLQGEPVQIDVYRVLDAFGVTDPAIQHAAKKLLIPGERGVKGIVQDLEEAVFSIKQAVELLKQKGGG